MSKYSPKAKGSTRPSPNGKARGHARSSSRPYTYLNELDEPLNVAGDEVLAKLEEHGWVYLRVQLGDFGATDAPRLRQQTLLSS